MSGGSYNYLCDEEVEQLRWREQEINRMVDRLNGLGCDDIAKDTIMLQLMVKRYFATMEATKNKLSPIWKAVEWHDSGDTGTEDLVDAILEYRELKGDLK